MQVGGSCGVTLHTLHEECVALVLVEEELGALSGAAKCCVITVRQRDTRNFTPFSSTFENGPSAKASYPKTDLYPTYDGKVTSDHRAFIDDVYMIVQSHQLPSRESVSKLPLILKDSALEWYRLERRIRPDASWDEWKYALIQRFETPAWRRHVQYLSLIHI